jgi:hypothetical protein
VGPTCQIVNVTEQYSVDDTAHTGLSSSGKALLSNGLPCYVEIPYFQNNQFNQFTFCGFFTFFERYPTDDMGLIFNGWQDDCFPGSIKIILTQDRKVKAGVVIENDDLGLVGDIFEITHSLTVSPSYIHKVCFRYDGTKSQKSLEVVVDGQAEKQYFEHDNYGRTVRKKCNLRLGASMDNFLWWGWWPHGFAGFLDTWCFSPKIVDETFFK